MADTLQVVSWSLERPCELRPIKPGWETPLETSKQLHDLRAFADGCADDRVFNGVCITACTLADGMELPTYGIQVDDALRAAGGVDGVTQTCGQCEANAAPHGKTRAGERAGPQIVGCHGWISMYPYEETLNRALAETIDRGGHRARVAQLLLDTNPPWLGLWTKSPLRRPQCELLQALLPPLLDGGFDGRFGNPEHLRDFLRALDAAVRWELPLHVRLAPPGHTDLGWDTTFAHCPRCKAEADVKRWTPEDPSGTEVCRACGNVYDCAATYSSVPDDMADVEASRLTKVLGQRQWESFCYAYLRTRGKTVEQIADALDRHNEGPAKRELQAARLRVEQQRLKYAVEPVPEADWPRLRRTLILDLGGGTPIEFRLIPGGEFLMGSGEEPCEQPVRRVRIARPFYIGIHLVTWAQWFRTIKGKASWLSRVTQPPKMPASSAFARAIEFATKASDATGRFIRLPSEAEWEYACRAGSTTRYAFGDVLTPAMANFRQEEDPAVYWKMKFHKTKVASYPPNAWGLFDMHGNGEEWCEDAWHDTYDGAPATGEVWAAAAHEDNELRRVIRGGSARTDAKSCRSAARRSWRVTDVDGHAFRVVCEISPADLLP